MCILQPSSCCLGGHYVCLHLCLVTGWHGHSSRHVSSYHGPHLCNVLLFDITFQPVVLLSVLSYMNEIMSQLSMLSVSTSVCQHNIQFLYVSCTVQMAAVKVKLLTAVYDQRRVMAVCSAVWLPSQLIHNWWFASWNQNMWDSREIDTTSHSLLVHMWLTA